MRYARGARKMIATPFTPVLWLAAVIVATGCSTQDPPPPVSFADSIVVGLTTRHFRVALPAPGTAQPPAALVVFHGFGIDAVRMESHTGLSERAREAGILVAHAQAGSNGAWEVDGGTSDVVFASMLVEHLVETYSVNPNAVLAAGLSNGGAFVYRLGCEVADRFRGIIAVSATMPTSVVDSCAFARRRLGDPVMHMLLIIGSDDTFFPIQGTSDLLSVDSTMAYWGAVARCPGVRTSAPLPSLVKDGTRVFRSVSSGCSGGRRIEMDSIAGGGHGWPGAVAPLNPAVVGVTSRNLSANDRLVSFVNAVRNASP